MTFKLGSSLIEKFILDIIITFNILHFYFWLMIYFFTYFRSFKQIVILGIIGLFFLFVIVPSIFRWSTLVQRQMVFLPWGEQSTKLFFFKYRISSYTVCVLILYTPVKSYVVKWPKEKEACHSHDDATPSSFQLQVTEDFFKIS